MIKCLFVMNEVLRPSQQFFSHGGAEPPLPRQFEGFSRITASLVSELLNDLMDDVEHNTYDKGIELMSRPV